jgi:FkbM family methyltransferase|tara:strand:+ start:29501 stop:30103 length:603 start_codon:yes stop_codon:yes gene_type:complete
MKMKKIIFDVGANNGSSCLSYSRKGDTVYAFEPTPFLLEKYLYPNRSDNYIVVPCAISDFNGTANFNIAGQRDWGCSSLHDFSESLDKTWPNRTDFKVTDSIEVEVMRLDTFINNNLIDEVDWMHCDTQGNDLKVLQSFGDKINILKGGVVEAFEKNPLYKESDNSKENVVSFLEDNNFKISSITSNDPFNNELNIKFTR